MGGTGVRLRRPCSACLPVCLPVYLQVRKESQGWKTLWLPLAQQINESVRADSLRQAATIKEVTANYRREMKLRRDLFNQILEMKGAIRVFCRVRPLSASEIQQGNVDVVRSSHPRRGHPLDCAACVYAHVPYSCLGSMIMMPPHCHNRDGHAPLPSPPLCR